MTRRTVVRLITGTVILIVASWWTLRSVDAPRMMHLVMTSNSGLLALAVPLILLSHFIRAHRWRILLSPSFPNIGQWRAYSSVLIGYAANTVFPRAGEIVRPWVLSRRERIPFGTAVSSVIVERTLDVITLLIGIALVSVLANDRITTAIPSFTFSRVLIVIVLPVAGLATLIGVLAFSNAGAWIIDRLIRPLRASFADRLHGVLTTVRTGMRAVGQPSLYARIALDTIGIWVLWIIPIWLTYHAVHFSHVVPFGLADATVLLLIISVGVTIAPTPGALGIYQSFAQGALILLYGAGQDEALAFGMLSWALNYAMVFLVGAGAWIIELRQGLGWRDLLGSSRNP